MLTVVPTPIGNLRDITLRALERLKAADLIVCEDTRQTRRLLDAYEIRRPVISYHEHSGPLRAERILAQARSGEVALVTDSGTPLVSDPGFELVHGAIADGIALEVLPGPAAFVTALVASGLATDAFGFFGFPPAKSAARRKFFAALAEREETLIFYESPYRVAPSLKDLLAALGDREAAAARELTKKFEEIARGRLSELAARFSARKALGEFVLVVAGRGRKPLFSRKES